MKKINKIILAIIISASLFSCSNFLEIFPENIISEEEFMNGEKDMELYANGLLQRYLPEATGVAFADADADNIAIRQRSTFLDGDTYRPEDQGNWGTGDSGKWAQLRNANWFLEKLKEAKDKVSPEIYNHYEGVGRYWRAYFYYSMVRTFGDVPWYDYEIDSNDTESLYRPRDSREFVMDKVLEDLNFASEHCLADNKFVSSSSRISKWVVLAFKSRVCLFEGTYRKYHTELNLTSSADKFLNEAISACEILMDKSPYGLVTGGDVKTQYRSLFISNDLKTKEVILGLAFKDEIRMHDITWRLFSGSKGSSWSFTKQFVDQYLMLDGSRFTDKQGYEKTNYNDEFTNRDWRLSQTVMSPSHTRKIGGVTRKVSPLFGATLTGYHIIKWAIDDDNYDTKANCFNSLPIFRYAEVLLNYAEAKAELGKMDETIWNKTIKPLRERAGVNGAAPTSYDPYLAKYYLDQTTDKWILEVRRERSIELAFEQVRYDDIMRWKLGKLIEKPKYGIYIEALDKEYDLNNDGKTDLVVSKTGDASTTRIVLGTKTNYALSEGDHGYLLFGINFEKLWLDKKYLRPIPRTATEMNPALGQNTGW